MKYETKTMRRLQKCKTTAKRQIYVVKRAIGSTKKKCSDIHRISSRVIPR